MTLNLKKWVVYVLSVLICAGSLATLFQTAFSEGPSIDPAYDRIEGSITSMDGTVLCAGEDDAHRGTVTDPQIYGSLLGHNDVTHGRSGLRQRYMDVLYADNGKDILSGNNLTLTINHSVQTYAYETMYPFSKLGGDTNSFAVVIENDTGRIIALVSIKAPLKTESGESIVYDINHVSDFDKALKENSITLPDGYYINEWAKPQAPGSVFKAISAIPIIENNLQNEMIKDEGYVKLKNNVKVSNYRSCAFGEINLNGGLKNSSNVYFSDIYDRFLSSADLKSIGEKALLGQDLQLDFATLSSSFDVSTYSKYIMSSFGQITAVTPVHTAAILSGICSEEGTVMKPYLVEEIQSPKGKTVEKTKTSVLTEVSDEKTLEILRNDLLDVAKHYGYDRVYMKTGTAELANNNTECYCFCANGKYTCLIGTRNLQSSAMLREASFNILTYTTSVMMNKEADEAYAEPVAEKKDIFAWFKEIFHDDNSENEQPQGDENSDGDSKKPDNSQNQEDGFFHSLINFFKS